MCVCVCVCVCDWKGSNWYDFLLELLPLSYTVFQSLPSLVIRWGWGWMERGGGWWGAKEIEENKFGVSRITRSYNKSHSTVAVAAPA